MCGKRCCFDITLKNLATFYQMEYFRKHFILLYVILGIFLWLVDTGESYTMDIDSLQRGIRLKSSRIFETFQPSLFQGCLKQCILRRRCKAFTFNSVTLTCQIGTSFQTETDVDLAYVTSKPSDWPQGEALARLCASHTCPVGTTCIALKEGTTYCRASECGPPTHVYFAVEQPSDFSIGATFTYQCQTGYVMNGGPATLKCKGDSKWTGREFYCTSTTCDTTKGFTSGTVCYKKYSNYLPPASARRTCESVGGQLAKLETSVKYSYIKSRVSNVHVDGNDFNQDGVWRYFDGSLITYNPWTSGYGSRGTNFNCRYLGSAMRDISCGDWYNFLCEIP